MFKVNDEITKGSIIRVKRNAGYYHYGVYLDDNLICHYSGLNSDDINNPENILIRYTDISNFQKDGVIESILHNSEMLEYDEIKNRCENLLGSPLFNGKYYDVITNNCEHFARWACYGEARSQQVDDVLNFLKDLFK